MATMTIQQAFDLAVQHHQAGRFAQAEALYRQILAHQPNHADGLHLLGVIAAQNGRHDAAVDLFRKAIAITPDSRNITTIWARPRLSKANWIRPSPSTAW